jgi:uncharacterized protein (DUF1330 family)
MAAYVVSEVEVLDEEQAGRYRQLAAASIARHGGRYLARGATPVVSAGTWPQEGRVIIVEFPSLQRALDWYSSADYAPARALAETALRRRLLFVDGAPSVDGAPTAPGLGWPEEALCPGGVHA